MKEKIYELILEASKSLHGEAASAGVIGEKLSLSRSVVSQYLNQGAAGGKLIKINSRPVLFFDVHTLETMYGTTLSKREYASLKELEQELKHTGLQDFDKLIGRDGSLSDVVKQCKATISYPPHGLPVLLHGPTGSGKSLIAKMMYEYAVNHEWIDSGSKFVTVNCSEYANNPELLSANLFGSVKGAYTGADKDNPGLLHAAEGGVLFLDEVHCLKAECQEKLFLFMDQGIYHMMGDNETWHHGSVRLVFATTEDPKKVLLKTLRRRIVMVIELPSLAKRGIHERLELIHQMFSREEARINRSIAISNLAYNILLTAEFSGNIGELETCIQASCVQALFDAAGERLEIHARHLPASLLKERRKKGISSRSNRHAMIEIDSLKQMAASKQPLIKLLDHIQEGYEKGKRNDPLDCLEAIEQIMEDDLDTLSPNQRSKRDDPIQDYIQEIWETTIQRYGIQAPPLDGERMMMLQESIRETSAFTCWMALNDASWQEFYEYLREHIHRELSIAQEITEQLSAELDQSMTPIIPPLLALFLHQLNNGLDISRRIGIIIAHGQSTASSIADAVNQFLGRYLFDAIDMPMEVSTAQIVSKLNDFLSKLGHFEELVLLVDMGSLEEIHKGIANLHANIGIMNNVNTRTALEIGNQLMQGADMESIFEAVSTNSRYHYQIIDNRDKDKVIICSCASGIGAAEKLREIIGSSLPKNIPIKVLTCEYSDLLHREENDLFSRYDVICIVGTLNPNLEYIHFVPIEDLIINETMDELDVYFSAYLNEVELKQFKQNILKNFSLSNIMNNLTILNPNKLLEHVAEALDHLQILLDETFSNHTCFGLYVHICCLIERLVTMREITDYGNKEAFEAEHREFIEHIHHAFHDVEAYYHISINVEEIGYIYDYIRSN